MQARVQSADVLAAASPLKVRSAPTVSCSFLHHISSRGPTRAGEERRGALTGQNRARDKVDKVGTHIKDEMIHLAFFAAFRALPAISQKSAQSLCQVERAKLSEPSTEFCPGLQVSRPPFLCRRVKFSKFSLHVCRIEHFST